jgi:hypothetical protein
MAFFKGWKIVMARKQKTLETNPKYIQHSILNRMPLFAASFY